MGGVVVEYEEEDELEPAEETDGENVGYSGDELDDEDEEEGQDEYEQDGFIVDEVEEELEESEVERHERRSKKKKKRDPEEKFGLDEDDYELLEDHNITGFRRPKAATNKFKRLKKAGRSIELEEQPGLSNEESIDRSNQDGLSAEEKLKHSLFGYDEVVMLEDDIAEEEAHSEDRSAIGDEDEMADFIVDEDVDEVGDLSTKKRLTKKKSHKLPGISSSALQEAKEIFGDVDELLMLRKQGLASSASDISCTEKRLEDEFEPFVLSEKYMTLKDMGIRETDVPERIQLFEDITGPPPTDGKNIEEESHWIYDMLTHGSISPLVGYEALRYINKKEIENVLTMMHLQKLDIPFISMYRKELCCSLLKDLEDNMLDREEIKHIKWHKILWAIWTLDKKWLLLQKRLIALRSYYSRCFIEETQRVDDEAIHYFNKIIFQSVISALNNAKSEREVDDIDAKFNMHFPPSEDDTYDGKFKRPKRKSTYSIFRKAGLWEIANKFGASSETFGMLLSLEKISDEVEDTKESPEEVAANYICSVFQTYKDVLNGARHMASVEIAYEPNVKKHVRSIFMKKAVVSTSPTNQGNLQIDAYHQLGGVKWLQNKPLSDFVDAQWLLIQKGEEDKLLKVTIKLPDDIQNKLLSDASDCYLSEGVSRSAKSWNDQRKMILKDSFFTYIFPSMEKEARSLLTTRAKYWLRMEYGRQLWNKVSIAPFQWNGSNSEDVHAARVMACCWGSGKSPTTIVMLDSEGEMVDMLYVNSFSVRSQTVADQQRKRNDQHQVLQLMMKHQPHVVCVGAANMACKRLSDDIYEVIFKIVEDHPTEVGRELENISTVFGDETLPCLYENLRVSSDQFPGHQGIVKRAVALGRYMQNPLAMVATLCGPGKEILSWKLHSLDHFLTPDEKYEVVEQIMVDATNQIGLDINLAASHEWLFAPLQFISGLGPRKASSLQKAFLRAGFISNRKEISMGKLLKKKVFTNAVGFLRVRRSGAAAATSHIMDLLDDTRIHPESYELAKNVAKDIYDEENPNEANVADDDMLEMVIEHVRENPHMLKLLDINEYAKSIFNSYGTNKKETLCDITMELLKGFRDCRTPFKEPSDEEKFAMLSGETNDTISVGRIVEVRVCHVHESQIICAFDSGLKGIVSFHDYSDEGFDFTKVHKGDILTCKIQRINTNRHVVYLTSKASDLRNCNYNLHNRDPYYVEGGVSAISKTEVSKSNGLANNHFTPRMIVHPRFQNLSADEATRHLSDKEPGESIIRPSSKGLSFLTLILKIFDGVYAHKQIIESKKDHKDMTSLLRLGKTLTIDKDTFEDLDEIMDRYVDPLATHLRRMLGYRKFRKGTRIEVDDLLRAEKIANPMRTVYCFGVSHEHPGTFILSYIRNANPHHEFIGLYPKGFRFRNKDFDDIDRLVHHFQENINNPPLAERPSLPTFAAVVPMKSNTWLASDGSGYTGERFDSRSTNSLDGDPNVRGCMNRRDSQIHTNDESNNSCDDKVQSSAGSESSGWKNGGTGGDQCGCKREGTSSGGGGGWQGSTGSNGDWSEYCSGSGKAVENNSIYDGWAADSSVAWGSRGTSGMWGSGSVASDGDESTLDGSQRSWHGRGGSSTGNWEGGNANDPNCSGRGTGRGKGMGRERGRGRDGWNNAGGHSRSNNGGRIGRGGRNERGRGGRSWRGSNAGGRSGRGSSGCGGGGGSVGSKSWGNNEKSRDWGSGFAATSGSNDGWGGGWGGVTNDNAGPPWGTGKSGWGDDWGSKSKGEGGKVVGDGSDWGATCVNGGGGSHVEASSGWGGNAATSNAGTGGGWGGVRTHDGNSDHTWAPSGGSHDKAGPGWGTEKRSWGDDWGSGGGGGGGGGQGNRSKEEGGNTAGVGHAGSGGGWGGIRTHDDDRSNSWAPGGGSHGEAGRGWGGQTSGGNAGSSGGGWGSKTREGNAGSSGGWNDGKTTDGSRKAGWGGASGGGSQGEAEGAWGSKTNDDNSKDGWSRSGAASRGGKDGGNKTRDSSSKGVGGGKDGGGWGGNKTSDSSSMGGGGGGGWGSNKASDSRSKGAGGGGWGDIKTNDSSSKGGGGGVVGGGDSGGWGGNKTSDSSIKGGGGGGGGWGRSKTSDSGSKGGGGGGSWGGNKTSDSGSKGGDGGGGWGGIKTSDSKGGGGGGGWGGNKTSDSSSKGGGGGGGGGWGGNKTSDSGSKGGGGGGWGGNKASDSGSKGGGGGGGWDGIKTSDSKGEGGGWGGNKTSDSSSKGGGGWI